MPRDPLIFVEVALTRGLVGDLRAVLDEGAPVVDPKDVDTAIFYSISNAQDGLAGIPFGNFLIKMAVAHLSRDLPNLKTFATLSPIPGFRRWLATTAGDAEARTMLEARLGTGVELPGIVAALDEGHGGAEEVLTRLAAEYLVRARGQAGRALDPVAQFHLSNGARIERINRDADPSAKGWEQSAGMMVNYRYEAGAIEGNVDRYRNDGFMATSSEVRRLLPG